MPIERFRAAASAALGLGLCWSGGIVLAQAPPPRQGGVSIPPPQQQRTVPQPTQGGAAGAQPRTAADPPGPIDNLQDLEDAGKLIFKAVDTNNDGQISKKEATDAGNLAVGGFFFRADANGDGVVTQEEMRHAREAFLQDRPLLRYVLDRAKPDQGNRQNSADSNPFSSLLGMLDTNQNQKLDAKEVRKGVETSVTGLFNVADTNRDEQLSPMELNAAMHGLTRGAMQALFQSVDTNNDDSISKDEFDKAVVANANIMFNVVDANQDGKISREEARNAARTAIKQAKALRVPEPPNSVGNLLRSGRSPEEVAPVPRVNPPTLNNNNPAPNPNAPR